MSNSLYGVSVSSTFQRLVQIVDGLYYDGLGNLLNIGGTGGITVGPTGPQGPTGSPGTSLMWMGSWTQSMYYVSYDTVSYNGSSYICLVNNPQNAPGISSSEWDIIAQGFSNSYTNQTPFISVTQSYNISNSDYYIDCNGTFDVTLPTADKIGKSFIIKNNGTGIITIKTSSLELIDNLESFILAFYDTLHIQSDGNNWQIINPQTKQFIRIINNTGQKIYKGTVLKIKQSNSIIPEVELPISSGLGNQQVSGLAYTDIENNTEGLIISSGILSGLNLSNYNIGDILYLSDTLNGGLINSTTSLKFSSRTNQIGYVTNNTSDLGTIQVEIVNENINLSLTDIQRNILEGNVISTGTYEFLGLSVLSPTTFNISPMKGWIVNNTGSYSVYPSVNNVIFNGATGVSALNISTEDNTYVLIGASANIITQNTFPTPIQRRENIYLGKVIHPNRISIQNINNTVDYDVSPVSMIRDIWTPIKLINDGISISPNDGNLSINISSGYLWGNGINWINNQLNPNQIIFTSQTLATFQYRTSLGATATFINGATATFTNRNTLLVDTWESSPGVLSSVGTPNAQATNIRVYAFPTGLIRLQFGQHVYQNLTVAAASVNSESFNIYSNNLNNGILIGIISVVRNATNLSNPTQALFTPVSKFGEIVGGAAGGSSTINLQQAFNNSATNPDILTSDNNPSFILKNGDGSDNTNILIVQNLSGTSSFYVSGSGNVNATSFSIIGNTFSYFLKSNGTLDTNIYLINNDLQPYALSSTLSNYYLASNPNGYITASSLLSYQPLLTNPIIGTGSTNQISYFVGTSSIVSSSNFVYDSSSGNLGLGTSNPDQAITLLRDNETSTFINTVYETTQNFYPPAFIGRKARGTQASPTAVQSGDFLFQLGGRGYNGSAFPVSSSGAIVVGAGGTFSTNSLPTYVGIEVTPSDSIIRREVFRVNFNGNVGIGTTNPLAANASRKALVITDTTYNTTIRQEGNSGVATEWITTGASSAIGTRSSHNFTIFTSGNDRMNVGITGNILIDSNIDNGVDRLQVNGSIYSTLGFKTLGNIGIGTTSPTHALTFNSTSTGIVLYNTTDQTTHFERVRIYFGGDNFNIGSEQGGSGTSKNIVIYAASRLLTIFPNGNNGGFFNFNTTTSTNIPTIGITTILNGTSSTIQNSLAIIPTINQSFTAGYRGLWISPFESSTGSGNRYLIDVGINTSASGTGTHSSRMVLTSAGNMGIGITTPAALCHIYGSMAIPLVVERISQANTTIQFKNSGFSSWIGIDGNGDLGFSRTSADLGNFSDLLKINRSSGKLNLRTGNNTSVGSVTLTNGVVTVANAAVTGASMIFIQNINTNGSTMLGKYIYTVNPSVGFTIISRKYNNPVVTEIEDNSIIVYWIIN